MLHPFDSDTWEVSRENLVVGEVLGRGAFGQVVQGQLFSSRRPSPTSVLGGHGNGHLADDTEVTVAVKMLLG